MSLKELVAETPLYTGWRRFLDRAPLRRSLPSEAVPVSLKGISDGKVDNPMLVLLKLPWVALLLLGADAIS